ncbi:hypothetical protein OAG1_18270 [Agarivorans sp. OAG1]|uniref:hypothetical protein n=1 Tax=Agarivorans sp. OAG1 TaxID=3082387 RepID=UPI002B2DBE89|nr:hypothetical protein OAG1_18270 [Agarivorans sp. OAG1]
MYIMFLGFVDQFRIPSKTLLSLIFLLFISQGHASQSSIVQSRVKYGYVMANTVITDENGEEIWVEYNEDGSEAGPVNLPHASSQLKVIPSAYYLSQQLKLQSYLATHANDLGRSAQLLTRSQYNSTNFLDASSKAINKPALSPNTKSVLVRGQTDRLTASTDLILLNFDIDLSQNYTIPQEHKSLIIDRRGAVLASYKGAVGPKVGFFGDSNNVNTDLYYDPSIHQIYGPIEGVRVSVTGRENEAAITNGNGLFTLTTYLPYCSPWGNHYTVQLAAPIHYQAFNPQGLAQLPYWIFADTYDFCMSTPQLGPGLLQSGVESHITQQLNLQSIPKTQVPLLIDIMSLSGQISIQNANGNNVAISNQTRYQQKAAANTPVAQQYFDFDKDGIADITKLGRLETISQNQQQVQRFTTELNGEEASIQGVWFSSNLTQNREPDLIRQADGQSILSDTGLLTSISTSDLANTDILVFRESTGEIIVNRQGLKATESNSSTPFYRITLRGLNASTLSMGADIVQGQTFADWSSSAGYTASYQQRASNHLKPGEWVNIVAINRSTGYLGTIRTQLTSIANSTPLDPIILRPPNIKVWAERKYNTEHGITSGQNHHYLIGSEGASLLSDNELVVYTEWLNTDGSPLPSGLANNNGKDYGFTGRLAKIVAPNLLDDASGSQLSHFSIRPNRQTQVIKFANDDTVPNHFYIHVSAEPANNAPSFAGSNQDFAGRPSNFVPLLTPLHDEAEQLQQWMAYNALSKQYQAANLAQNKPNQPLPSYQWLYRPEYQFSRYQFTTGLASSNNKLHIDQDSLANETLSQDELLAAFYSLLGGEYDRLSSESAQTFILALGENELKLQISADGTITFSQSALDYLSQLEPEDYISLRLYLNQDSENILWDYAFQSFGLIADMNHDGQIRKTNDNNQIKDTNNTANTPLLIWSNDNHNGNLKSRPPTGQSATSVPDYSDDEVNGLHDLVDFFPVYLDLTAALERFPTSQHQYSLQQKESAIAFFGDVPNSNIDPENTQLELRPEALLKHPPTAEKYKNAKVTLINDEGIALNEEFVNRIAQGIGGVIFIEAKTETSYQSPFELVLNITQKSDDKSVAKASLWVVPSKVQHMFRHANLRNVPNPVMDGDQHGLPDTGASIPLGYPDSRSQNNYFVFLHGFRVGPEAAETWHSTIFKRLYRLGFKGRFMGVTWYGDTGKDYHAAVYNAFNTSQYLPAAIQQKTANANKTYIAAHSLGNVVVSNAISHQSLEVDKYFMFNAAVPLEAYDGNQIEGDCAPTGLMKDCMREKDMHGYPEKLFASEWHKLFPDTDPRKDLTWNNIFAPALSVVHNFYSPGDDVLENAKNDESFGGYIAGSLTGIPILDWDFNRHAWLAQEMAKGSANTLAAAFSRRQGGWTANNNADDLEYIGRVQIAQGPGGDTYHQYKESQVMEQMKPDGRLSDQHLAQFGFFRRFEFSKLYAPIGDVEHMRSSGPSQQDMLELFSPENKNHTLWSLLAHAIPARSFAVATNAIRQLDDPDNNRNFNMQALRPKAPGGNAPYWPSERIDDEYPYDWLHSDFKDLPLPFVHHTFDKLLELLNAEDASNDNN